MPFLADPVRYAALQSDWRGRLISTLLLRRMVPDRKAAEEFCRNLEHQLVRQGTASEKAAALIQTITGMQVM